MRLLKRPVIVLGILVLGLAVYLAPRARAAAPDTFQRAGRDGPACAASSVEILTDRGGLRDETGPGELAPAQQPMPFDCGIGETWRHHVP